MQTLEGIGGSKVIGSLPPTWAIWGEFPTPGFSLAKMFWALGNEPTGGDLCLCLSSLSCLSGKQHL